MSNHDPMSLSDSRHIAGVRSPDSSLVHYVSTDDLDLAVGTWVVVQTERGKETAQVVIAPGQVANEPIADAELHICRRLDDSDLERMDFLRGRAKSVVERGNAIATGMGLDLKLTSCVFSLDGSYLVVFWNAPEMRHVDDLRDQLASEYDVAVEMRRIGSEGEARLIGGLGRSVPSLDADHPLIDSSRENERYQEIKRGMPHLGQRVRTAEGPGTVIGIKVFDRIATVRYDEPGNEVSVPVSDIQSPPT